MRSRASAGATVAAALAITSAHASVLCGCPADFNDSGSVDGGDLGVLLSQWGTAGNADLNGDGVVNGADLGILLGAWGPCPPPSNNACADAIQIGSSGFIDFCTINATTDGPGVSGACGTSATQIFKDVWYTYFAEGSGTLGLSTCNDASFDTIIAVYGSVLPGANPCPDPNGLPGLSTLLACNDDAPGCSGLTSRVEVDVVAGSWYRIRVGGFNGASGEGVIDIDFTSVGTQCFNGIPVFGQNGVTKTVSGITTDNPHVTTPCAIGSQGGEWITYIPSCSNEEVFVSTCNPGTNYDTVLVVWRDTVAGGCTGELKLCVDDSQAAPCSLNGFPRKSQGSFFAVGGEIYHILVSGFNGAEGAYELTIHTDCN